MKKHRFTIKYFPYTGKYIVQVRKRWLGIWWLEGWLNECFDTGKIRIEDMFELADYVDSKAEAQRLIDLYCEQWLGTTAKIISVQ